MDSRTPATKASMYVPLASMCCMTSLARSRADGKGYIEKHCRISLPCLQSGRLGILRHTVSRLVDEFSTFSDAAAIISALHRESWFTSMDIQDVKLVLPCAPMILLALCHCSHHVAARSLRRNRSFAFADGGAPTAHAREYRCVRLSVIDGIGARPEYWPRLSECITRNLHQTLVSINLSNNP